MPHFTVYNTRTGEIRCTGTQATIEWCHAQAGPGESVYLGAAPPGSYVRNGVPALLPERPSAHHVFDWSTHVWYDPRTPDELRQQLKGAIAEQRWKAETGGLTLPSGVRIRTGREDRAALMETLAGMKAGVAEVIHFKTIDGFVTLTHEEAEVLARAISAHVQRCFLAESAAHTFINALDDADIPASCDLADFMG
jgi:hypothetical protein